MHALQASRKRQEFGWPKVFFWFNIIYLSPGGGGGIRTRDTVSRIHTFQACAFDRSATPPSWGPYEKGASEAHTTARGAGASGRPGRPGLARGRPGQIIPKPDPNLAKSSKILQSPAKDSQRNPLIFLVRI